MNSRARFETRILAASAVLTIWLGGTAAQAATEAGGETPSRFLADRIERIGEHLDRLAHAVPALPSYFREVGASFVQAAGTTSVARLALNAAVCLIAGVVAEWAFRRAARGLRERRQALPIRTVSERLSVVGIDAAVELAAIVAFAVGALAVLLVAKRPGPINEVATSWLVAVVWLRLALALLRVLLRPVEGPARAFAAFDLDVVAARFWYRCMGAFIGWFAFGWAVVVTVRVFGMPEDGRQIFAYLLGTGLVIIALTMVWYPSTQSREQASGGTAGKWLASLAAIVFWLVWAVNAMTFFWFLAVAVGLPLAIGAARRASRHLLRRIASAPDEAVVPSVASVIVEQGLRALLIGGAIWLLLWGWNLDMSTLAAEQNTYMRLLRGTLHALIIVLAADLAWGIIKALADNALVRAQATPDLAAEEARKRARVRTLLPIGRNVIFIVLLVMSGLMVLAALGVEIAPLIASAGVVGVAVGFGAQTVVRDIISGMFYMLDDAFRVGEYIQSGNYKGTVESFSLRSIKLRHQRGALFTIPFGTLGAVQNMSRDWVIVKDMIGITYDSDIDKAKKLIKQIGLELAQDPDFGPNVLQPLKMQGVEAFGDFAIKIRMKMMTKPGEQFVIRRRANAMIKKAFDANGIRFAFPLVRVAGGEEQAAAAAAQSILSKPAG